MFNLTCWLHIFFKISNTYFNNQLNESTKELKCMLG